MLCNCLDLSLHHCSQGWTDQWEQDNKKIFDAAAKRLNGTPVHLKRSLQSCKNYKDFHVLVGWLVERMMIKNWICSFCLLPWRLHQPVCGRKPEQKFLLHYLGCSHRPFHEKKNEKEARLQPSQKMCHKSRKLQKLKEAAEGSDFRGHIQAQHGTAMLFHVDETEFFKVPLWWKLCFGNFWHVCEAFFFFIKENKCNKKSFHFYIS